MLKETIDLVAPVVRRVDSAIHWINLYPLKITRLVLLVFMRWIVIYPVDSIIHLLNNQGQCRKLKLQVVQETEHKWNLL